jgi:multisubunit Na+/H+ antiporter MnhC subunit
MGDARTAGLLVLAIGVFAMGGLLRRARLARSHRNVGGLVTAIVLAAIVIVLAASAVVTPSVWESAYDSVSDVFFGG